MPKRIWTEAMKRNRNGLLRARQNHQQNREMGPETASQLAISESGERFDEYQREAVAASIDSR